RPVGHVHGGAQRGGTPVGRPGGVAPSHPAAELALALQSTLARVGQRTLSGPVGTGRAADHRRVLRGHERHAPITQERLCPGALPLEETALPRRGVHQPGCAYPRWPADLAQWSERPSAHSVARGPAFTRPSHGSAPVHGPHPPRVRGGGPATTAA